MIFIDELPSPIKVSRTEGRTTLLQPPPLRFGHFFGFHKKSRFFSNFTPPILSFSVGIPWYELQHKETFLTFKLGDIFRVRCISGLILSQTWIFCCESMWWTRILDSGRRAGSWSPHGSLAPKHAYMTWLRCLGTQYCRYKKIHHLMQTAAASIDARHSAA